MNRDKIINDYFNWLFKHAVGRRFSSSISYKKLLKHLYNVHYRWVISKDKNRASDGIELRRRFACDSGRSNSLEIIRCLEGPCSVLEMLVALAIRTEETIMDNPGFGDRTGQWFWGMLTNLGLGSMTDADYDSVYVEDVVDRFLNNDYEPNGKGGLFTIRNCDYDLRTVEIWKQLCWYLDDLG